MALRTGTLTGVTEQEATRNLIHGLGKGVQKIMSKMGISTVSSYCGAQTFEALGLSKELIEDFFTGTVSQLDGVGLDVIAEETWKPFKILRGHNQDVTDLAWSRDGKRLVSGSVDNNVFVWDVARGSKLQKVLKEHNSYVQGVAYDPLNRYIASLSADRSMLVFNVNTGKTVHRVYKLTTGEKENNKDKDKDKDKEEEAEKENEVKSEEVKAQDEPVEAPAETAKKTTTSTSSKLFFDQTLTSFCRRLTFSPGGELLFAPSGIIETGGPEEYKNTVHVFQRSNLSR